MKRLVNTVTVFLLLISGAFATSADAKVKPLPVVEDVAGFSEKLIEIESNELSTFNDVKDYIKQVENLAESYYTEGKSLSKQEKTLKMLDEVAKYADNIKANGSTRDMMDCGILHTVIYHYKTGLNSKDLRGQIMLPVVSAVTDEIEAWLKLENTLSEYYAYSAFMNNQGGTIAYIFASGSAWQLAEARYNDTEQLLKAGFSSGARNFPMSNEIKEKANSIVNSFSTSAKDLMDCEDDFKESPYYNEVSKDLSEACKNLKTDLKAWINARLKVLGCLEDQGIGIGETLKLLDNIKKIGEQEK